MYINTPYVSPSLMLLTPIPLGPSLTLIYAPGNPYCGKASDMWATGVLLYTMLYGQFPFYDSDPQELFRKIRAADYSIPR